MNGLKKQQRTKNASLAVDRSVKYNMMLRKERSPESEKYSSKFLYDCTHSPVKQYCLEINLMMIIKIFNNKKIQQVDLNWAPLKGLIYVAYFSKYVFSVVYSGVNVQ